MFSGIVEELGTIKSVHSYDHTPYVRLRIEAKRVLCSARKGDSIAVNGVCLTVIRFSFFRSNFDVEVLQSSLEKTTLASLSQGDRVNLESSLRIGDRLGGHFVQGHVENTGRILQIQEQAAISSKGREVNRYFSIGLDQHLMRYMIAEGSVALDGISLTIAKKNQDSIEVNIIPHTFAHTVLCQKKEGDLVNVEADMFVKYLAELGKHGFNHDFNSNSESKKKEENNEQ